MELRRIAVLIGIALLAFAAGHLVGRATGPTASPAPAGPPAPPAPPPAADRDAERLQGRLAEADRRIAELEAALAVATAPPPAAPPGGSDEAEAATAEDAGKRAAGLARMEEIAYRLQADWGNLDLLEEYVDAAIEAGASPQAVEVLSALTKQHPDSANLACGAGFACLEAADAEPDPDEQGRLAVAAVAHFGSALEIDPEHFEARLLRGITNLYLPAWMNRLPHSIADLERLVEQSGGGAADRKYAEVYGWLAWAYEKAGRKEEAEKSLARGRKLFPGDEELEDVIRRFR